MRGTAVARPAAGLAAALLAGALIACAGLERNPRVVGTYSDKLSPYNFREDGALVTMVVGVDAARYIRDEPYFPLFVQLLNKTRETFHVTREAFVLEDSLGRQYSLAPAREVSEKYARVDLDRRAFQRNRSITATYVAIYRRIGSDFFPSSARFTVVHDRVSVPPKTFLEDVLYFPVPEGGLNDVPLRLLFKDKALEEPIQVVFEVPRTLGVFEKEDD
ncbi:MAG: hypothetical protein ACE5JH_08035 [Acidobacteriota bacterium]